ncbi:hypothetical protein NC652_041014 [Populus alba x Populus x berolinensis]|uniref:Uncharacterized protein n=1 Tax=Populus alba x Populus x berolinensis TaxID=444605 RepID=A0AAD6L7T8_9ROSI|nr:hypothetical protein NC652_041005 [Populus alba x Populus x berolinensis]KAJ6858586.1 hypothetical protein NC652_041008 [Populus alba x Populus x berolinensis]KAJ6858592.1 hypothetical protein NC652_041014 [Populus alba x Populus x berolinensis]KAJ6951952.1 hypothetical protein NC653_041197 [Populus alba x Populus x berolinensis]
MGCPTLFFDKGCLTAFHAPLHSKLPKPFMKERHYTKQKSFYQIKVLFWHRNNHQDKERKYNSLHLRKSLQLKIPSSTIFANEYDTNII